MTRPALGWQLLVFGFLALLGTLIVRTHVVEDDRYGFSMFRHVVVYRIRYHWVREDGRLERHVPGDELVSRAQYIRGQKHDSIFGIGAIRTLVRTYLEHMWRERRPQGVKALQARLTYRINERGEPRVEVLREPGP